MAGFRAGHVSLTAILWAYSLAIITIGTLPRMPTFQTLLLTAAALLASVLLLPARSRLLPLLLAALAGGSWSLWHNQQGISQRLPLSAHGADFLLEVEVVSLPELRRLDNVFGGTGASDSLRFSARVITAIQPVDSGQITAGRLLDLTWYRIDDDMRKQLRAGSRWILPVRLKRPRGSVNPHGFDYEGWLLRRGVFATGYVRPGDWQPRWLAQGQGLAALRHRLRDRLLALAPDRGALLSALLLGDRGGLSEGERLLLRQTGTSHLLAISGLHVGLVAGLFLLLGRLCGRTIGLYSGVTPRLLAVVVALVASLAYTLLAGAPLSAQRALVMTWVLLIAWQWRRRIHAGFAFSLSLALVLTLQPLAFFGAGFWLSFIAVGALLLGFSGRQRLGWASDVRGASWVGHSLQSMSGLFRGQWFIALALFLPSLLYFSGASPAGVLLNLVAIPWLGCLVLPPLLFGALMIATPIGVGMIDFAAWQLNLMMRFLEVGQSVLPSWQTLGAPSSWLLLASAGVGVVLLLLPAGLPGRRLGWLFLLPPLLPFLPQANPEEAGFRVTALDVGQGLAVVLRTPQQTLVYDAGPVSGSGWSAGSQIVAPYLLGEGVAELDVVVISHGDSDHAGGFAGLMAAEPPARVIAPGLLADRLGRGSLPGVSSCRSGRRETFDDVELLWLWPEDEQVSGEENDHSCVALVQWQGVRVLLTGDISRRVERQLVRRYPGFAPVDLLIVPHHGSRSSSSAEFIRWAQPANVVFSAGFRHHFGHPHPQVVSRYREVGASLWSTAASGAITWRWREGHTPSVTEARTAGPFWYRSSDNNVLVKF
ncbi:competence protein ComEC [Microbulbifer donghaiensis]|uniref:Competence protein ComEC n=1 Tax=Microbulbifer donghaiensis TaxID=494016 RepID=A0A1M4UAJ8_9GAMM|nr:DNA internalization-related competence protein ComEC/Rec2 [Microbulbifer donghaiensis]SHE53627.1 competence protein ComEC [Microbulbifer donghaiensis]